MYKVHRIDVYIDLSAMVVEGISLHVENILFSLVLSIIISCIFRILRKTNAVMCTKYWTIFCLKHSNRLKPGLGIQELFFKFLLINDIPDSANNSVLAMLADDADFDNFFILLMKCKLFFLRITILRSIAISGERLENVSSCRDPVVVICVMIAF